MRRSQLTNIHAILTSINIYWNVTSTKVKKCAKYFHLSQGVPFLITSDEVRWGQMRCTFFACDHPQGDTFFCARNKFRCSKITKVPRYKIPADWSETKEIFRNRLQRNVVTPEFRDTTMIEFIVPESFRFWKASTKFSSWKRNTETSMKFYFSKSISNFVRN